MTINCNVTDFLTNQRPREWKDPAEALRPYWHSNYKMDWTSNKTHPPLHSASDGCEEWGDESRMKLCREVVRSWTASAGARETGQRGNGESTSAEGRRPPVATLEEDPSTSEVPVEGSGGWRWRVRKRPLEPCMGGVRETERREVMFRSPTDRATGDFAVYFKGNAEADHQVLRYLTTEDLSSGHFFLLKKKKKKEFKFPP